MPCRMPTTMRGGPRGRGRGSGGPPCWWPLIPHPHYWTLLYPPSATLHGWPCEWRPLPSSVTLSCRRVPDCNALTPPPPPEAGPPPAAWMDFRRAEGRRKVGAVWGVGGWRFCRHPRGPPGPCVHMCGLGPRTRVPTTWRMEESLEGDSGGGSEGGAAIS